ncbi:MAG: hypothetical protein IT308_04810 [Anaerolineaceae bacterium]|nr:hypothetical protein [Anaerolineaceae bacterium]
MERKVPSTASEEIELYLRTIYSLLRSTTEVQIRTLEEVHAATNSLLHPHAREIAPDISAFIYTLLRLPAVMPDVHTIILGQSIPVFIKKGYNVEHWELAPSPARRRRCLYDGQGTLACIIASRTDIEDVIPTLTAFQIEWNKLHALLQKIPPTIPLQAAAGDDNAFSRLARLLEISTEDLGRLETIWGKQFSNMLGQIAAREMNLRALLLNSSLSEYWRATRAWLDNIETVCPDLQERPLYFVSSNPHSLSNLFTGFALQKKGELIEFLQQSEDESLIAEWKAIRVDAVPSNESNFLYYILKKCQQSERGAHLLEAQKKDEEALGILRIPSVYAFDVEANIIDLSKINSSTVDPRLSDGDLSYLKKSNALILNIDYPLGLAAYNILAKIAEHSGPILGVYFMGKAATLNGVRGDVMIPSVVQDEHSQNTYLFQNAFNAQNILPYLVYGTVLDNQKALSVLGTFLQNARIMDVVYREGYTDIEMEAGPYLSAVYEMHRPKRHPVNEIVNLYGVPFDIGILHYASDTPLSKGKNLGAGTLSYFGMDSTYACSVAILRRIFALEKKRLGE